MRVLTYHPPIMAILFVAGILWPISAWSVILVQDGRSECTIVVPLEDGQIVEAARDLQYHLRTMSGAEVPIVHAASQVKNVGIYLDTKPLDVHVPGRLVDRTMTWPDGYVIEIIKFDGKTGVFLSSPVPSGISHAVYGMLEDHLGCHWFTIGPIGEHIPRRRTVELNIPGDRQVASPGFERRTPWYNGHPIGMMTRDEISSLNQWYRRNRRGGPLGPTGHAWEQIFNPDVLAGVDEDGDGVSDLAVLHDGKRRAEVGGMCMSHPQAIEIATRHFIRLFDSYPQFDFASFFQFDSGAWCRCQRCLEMGSNHGARLLILSNRIAENVHKAHPGKRLMLSAYKETREPPDTAIPAHPNLFVQICSLVGVDKIQPMTAAANHHFRRQVERWMKILPSAWNYDYVGMPNGPWTLFGALQETLDFYRDQGYTGVATEYVSRNMGTDVHMWLTFRTAWDGNRRIEDLLGEFYPAYFGPAADDMRWVYEQIEQHMLSSGTSGSIMDAPRAYPPPLVDACLARIRTAKPKVADDQTRVSRIERDENCLEATRLWVRFCLALAKAREDRPKARKACASYLAFLHRLDAKLTLGGNIAKVAKRMHEALVGPGTYFAESGDGQPWPGPFRYYDNLDRGGKTFDAVTRSGFHVGPFGLYLKPGEKGEVVYDMRLAKGLAFKQVYLPGGPGGVDLAIKLALPDGGRNGIEVSLDQGRSWISVYKDLETRGDVVKYDMTQYVGGSNRFLLKFWVQNTPDREILAMDAWTITGTAESADHKP